MTDDKRPLGLDAGRIVFGNPHDPHPPLTVSGAFTQPWDGMLLRPPPENAAEAHAHFQWSAVREHRERLNQRYADAEWARNCAFQGKVRSSAVTEPDGFVEEVERARIEARQHALGMVNGQLLKLATGVVEQQQVWHFAYLLDGHLNTERSASLARNAVLAHYDYDVRMVVWRPGHPRPQEVCEGWELGTMTVEAAAEALEALR